MQNNPTEWKFVTHLMRIITNFDSEVLSRFCTIQVVARTFSTSKVGQCFRPGGSDPVPRRRAVAFPETLKMRRVISTGAGGGGGGDRHVNIQTINISEIILMNVIYIMLIYGKHNAYLQWICA